MNIAYPIKTTVGSDIQRDGMYLEITDATGALILEIFYSDQTGKYSVDTFGKDIAQDFIDRAMDVAVKRLPPVNDGSA